MQGTVLITGGASGLGAAVVQAVLDDGGTPTVLDLKPPAADVPYLVVDLADARCAERAAREAVAQIDGALIGVVTAAGVDTPGRLEDVPAEEWERVVRINLLAPAAVIRAVLPELRAARGGVVTIASTLGHRALGDATAYCASKFGLVGFTRALAAELAGDVGVTLITPGGMRTAFFDGREERYRPGPDADLMDPAEVADAVVYALHRSPTAVVRELVVCPPAEPSYP